MGSAPRARGWPRRYPCSAYAAISAFGDAPRRRHAASKHTPLMLSPPPALAAATPVLQSLAAVPFGSIVIVLLIWMFISFPLCLFGTVVGRNWAGAPDHPCR